MVADVAGGAPIVGQNVYFYNNHPIQFLCLAGVIVQRDEQVRRTILILDDSSGATIEVVCDKPDQLVQAPRTQFQTEPRPRVQIQPSDKITLSDRIIAEDETGPSHLAAASRTSLDISPLEPGVRAKLRGTITQFRGMLQLHLERYVLIEDTNAEMEFLEQRTRFLVDVLCVPWVLGEDEIEWLRRRCEEADLKKMIQKRSREQRIARAARREAEREERYRLRIEKQYAKDEIIRQKLAAKCAEVSQRVNRKLSTKIQAG